MAESKVKAFKQALDNLMPANVEKMNHAELFTLLKRCCNLINERPLGVRKASYEIDSDILLVTPTMLLLERSSAQSPEDENQLTCRIKFIQEAETQWWRMWYCQVWGELFPCNKWVEKGDNLKPRDICLKRFSPALKKGKYKICRVVESYPDKNGLVRTVKIQFRPYNAKEAPYPMNPTI